MTCHVCGITLHPMKYTDGFVAICAFSLYLDLSLDSCDLFTHTPQIFINGPLSRYVQLRFAHVPGRPGTFSPPPRVSDPDKHYGTCVTHVPWCMLGSLTSGFLWSRWRGKRSRYSRRIHNPRFYVSGKRRAALGLSSDWPKPRMMWATSFTTKNEPFAQLLTGLSQIMSVLV